MLEHVEDEAQFLYDLTALLMPGGWLVLTMDYAPVDGPDRYHFHWMRQRIYTPTLLTRLIADLARLHCRPYLAVDYRAPEGLLLAAEGYTFASLVVRKALRP